MTYMDISPPWKRSVRGWAVASPLAEAHRRGRGWLSLQHLSCHDLAVFDPSLSCRDRGSLEGSGDVVRRNRAAQAPAEPGRR